MVPIAYIGNKQRMDIENSTGIRYINTVGRLCTVIKPDGSNDRGDKSPYRMSELFGKSWKDYNIQFVAQVPFCPFNCPYCYVDNKDNFLFYTVDELIDLYIQARIDVRKMGVGEVNVFHLMGGNPSMFSYLWSEFRRRLDERGYADTVLFSDSLLVEEYLYGIKPWKYMDLSNFLLTGCLKGTNSLNFLNNTGGKDLYDEAIRELEQYKEKKNFYLTVINGEKGDIVPFARKRVDVLNVINYWASPLHK